MATKASHLVRPLVALVALVAAMAALLIVYGASPTHAAGSCSTTSGTTTCTFASTGAEDTFVVPAGVSSIHAVATGAPGALGARGLTGGLERDVPAGRGAQVSGDLAVTPGQTLYVEVGGAPTGALQASPNCVLGVDCLGGFNGGGKGGAGGGGGGASDVRTISRAQGGSLSSRVIVAAGGGGAGATTELFAENTACTEAFLGLGGAGGDAGSVGGDGQSCIADGGQVVQPGGTGGKAGGQSAGGAGGLGGFNIPPGTPLPTAPSGSLGLGGNGFQGTGGGGGGGLYGGGGGGGLVNFQGDPFVTPAGGGGGGSNLVPEGGTATLDDSGDPSIVISYQGGLGEEPPTEPEDKQACKKGGWKELGFKNQGQCIKAVNDKN